MSVPQATGTTLPSPAETWKPKHQDPQGAVLEIHDKLTNLVVRLHDYHTRRYPAMEWPHEGVVKSHKALIDGILIHHLKIQRSPMPGALAKSFDNWIDWASEGADKMYVAYDRMIAGGHFLVGGTQAWYADSVPDMEAEIAEIERLFGGKKI